MNLMYVLLILASAAPSLWWTVQTAREPKEERSIGAIAGLLVLALVSTAFLLFLLHFEYLL